MAIQEIGISLQDADSIYRVTLNGTPYRLRIVWNEYQYAAFMSLYDEEGAPLYCNRRLSPGCSPCISPLGPPGVFYVEGFTTRPYGREDVGRDIKLLYIEKNTPTASIYA